MVKRGLILGGLLALFFFVPVYAAETEFSIEVPSASLQITVPSEINIDLQPISSAAVFDSEILTFNVATNNPTGYRVLMSVPQTDMPHSTVSGFNLPTLSVSTTEANFPANKWGYKTTGDYNPVKLSNEDPAWNSDDPTNGRNHSLTLAAKVDTNQAAGTYMITLTFRAVANPNAPKDTIVFNANNADATGTTSSQIVFRGEPTTLNSNGYSVEGYSFKGWSTRSDGFGTGYGDEDTYTDTLSLDAPTSTITLYAQWEAGGSGGYSGKTLQAAFEEAYVNNPGQFPKDGGGTKHGLYVPEKDPVTGTYTGNYFEARQQSDYAGIPANDLRFAIQHINMLVDGQTVCERATVIGSEAYVLDLRDYKSYWIAKLADGKCWMTQNLALDLSSSKPLTHEYSDIGWGTDTSTNSWTPSSTANTVTISGTSVDWALDNNRQMSARTNEQYLVSFNNGSMALYESNAACSNALKVDGRTCQHFNIGNFYNWRAASAGTNIESLGAYGITQNSICPSGWKLPSGPRDGAISDWQTMLTAQNIWNSEFSPYGTINIRLAPLYLMRSGFVFNYQWYKDSFNRAYYLTSSRNGSSSSFAEFYFNVRDFIGHSEMAVGMYGENIRCMSRD